MWIPLHNCNEESGYLRVAAVKNNKKFVELLEHKRELTSDHHVTCKNSINSKDIINLPIKTGGVIFFNFNEPHSTIGNNSNNFRAAIA